jgi:hypothetical protein
MMKLSWRKNPDFPKIKHEYLLLVDDGHGAIERRATIEETVLISRIKGNCAKLKSRA